jgi:hypothetical protein
MTHQCRSDSETQLPAVFDNFAESLAQKEKNVPSKCSASAVFRVVKREKSLPRDFGFTGLVVNSRRTTSGRSLNINADIPWLKVAKRGILSNYLVSNFFTLNTFIILITPTLVEY